MKSRDEIISRFARLYPRKMEFDNILSEYSVTQEISWGSMSPNPFTTLRLRRSFRKSVSIDPRSTPGTSYSILLQCASFEHCLSSGCKGSQTRGPLLLENSGGMTVRHGFWDHYVILFPTLCRTTVNPLKRLKYTANFRLKWQNLKRSFLNKKKGKGWSERL